MACGVVGGAGGYIGVGGLDSGSFNVLRSDCRDDGDDDRLGNVERDDNEDDVNTESVVGPGFAGASFGVNHPLVSRGMLLFGGASHVSRRTGKDKRMSGWPFGDKKGRGEALKQT